MYLDRTIEDAVGESTQKAKRGDLLGMRVSPQARKFPVENSMPIVRTESHASFPGLTVLPLISPVPPA